MRNLHLISRFLCLYNLLELGLTNHLKVRHVCEDQHIDITKASGVGLEANYNSNVALSGFKFPNSSFADGDKLNIQFRTASLNGLIFHAESHHKKHELSVWVHDGHIRLRISAHCHWLQVRDIITDSNYTVSDNNFHTINIFVKSTGVSFSVDYRDEKAFYYASTINYPIFRCWHIEKFYFGVPSPSKIGNTVHPEYSMRMDGCIRNFTSQKSNGTDTRISAAYKRVSSCEDL